MGMPELFLNPKLPNYFHCASDMTSPSDGRCYVEEYEDAKVIYFPNLNLGIDHDFWSHADTDQTLALKKFAIDLLEDQEESGQRDQHLQKLRTLGLDESTIEVLSEQMLAIYKAILPIYKTIFSHYDFDRQKVVWRLNPTMAENMHVDTYRSESKLHFARMFINLDNQPRIWQTSWTIQDMVRQAKSIIPPEKLEGLNHNEVWAKINATFFGKNSLQWWDDQPRHIAFFAPGDVWVVDSRQVSHQVFYGRRALSIDFSVPRGSMGDPDVHYLKIAERFRTEVISHSHSVTT